MMTPASFVVTRARRVRASALVVGKVASDSESEKRDCNVLGFRVHAYMLRITLLTVGHVGCGKEDQLEGVRRR